MAGIAGIARLDGLPPGPEDALALDGMGDEIAHRGLAARAVRTEGPVGLVLPRGGGALASEDGTIVAVVDGRIANAAALRRDLARTHRFATDHPAEALVHLYEDRGEAALDDLVGAYAIALVDLRRRLLLLARDRVGARPLFFAKVEGGGALLFGSEVKALLAHPSCPRSIDWLGTLGGESIPFRTHAPTSYFQGIDPVPPGGLAVVDLTRDRAPAVRRYWELRFLADEAFAADRRPEADAVAGYRAAIEAAVRDALGAGECGVLLSGGIDSIAVAALAARERAVRTFTVLGASTLGNGDAGFARAAADRLGLPNHQVVFRSGPGAPGAPTPDAWLALLWRTETPRCGPQHLYKEPLHRFARERYPGLDVVLTGEGSDELVGADFANSNDDRPDATCADYFAWLRLNQRESAHTLESVAVESRFARPVFRPEFLEAATGRRAARHPWHLRAEYNLAAFDANVLWRDDRIAAAHGIASFAPFMDHRLLEYVAALPPRLYETLFWKKRILREALAPDLPFEIRWRPKIPFFAGVDGRFTTRLLLDTLQAEDRALIREAFGDASDARDHPVLVPGLVASLVAEATADPEARAVLPLLELVNLALLERLARDASLRARARAAAAAPAPLVELEGPWDEGRAAAAVRPPRAAIAPAARPVLEPGVELLRRDAAGESDPPTYVVLNDAVRFVIEGAETRAWREVLRRIDGRLTLAEVLAAAGVGLEEVSKSLEEAIEFGVLRLEG